MKSSLRSVIAATALLHFSLSTTNAFAPTKGVLPAHSFGQQRQHAKIEPQTAWKSASRFSAMQPLEASPFLTAIASSPAGALLVLAGIVVVHESGHYLAARSFGIKVEEFSVGFGPKLLGFNAFGNEFNLRAVPLGGYVRFPENYNATLVQAQEREAYAAEKEDKKARGVTTGQEFVNTITFGFLEKKRRKREEAQRLFDAEREAEEQKSLPFWSKFGKKEKEAPAPVIIDPDDIEIDYYDNPDLLQNRSWQQRAVVLSGGVIFNILLSFSIYFGQIGFGPGLQQPVFESGVVVNSVPRSDGPANGILRKGDVIMSANGNPITLSESPTAFEAQKAISNFIAIIRETPDGEPIKLSVLHLNDAKPVELSIMPRPTQVAAGSTSGSVGPKSIGIFLTPHYVASKVLKSDSLPEAAKLAYDYASEVTSQTANGLLTVARESLSGKGGPAGQQVSGPIGLIKTGSEIVATKDLNTVLMFAAAISINLAVVNSFPLPGLDGGQLVFVLAEAVSGRKIDQQLQEGITGVTVLLLLLTSVGTAFGDVQALFMR
jgi:membrane-associated protease RseP (regulator of RpoE activity)